MASEGNSLRVVLLGKTGAGKSSLGNSLTNITNKDEKFKVGKGLKSETRFCDWKKGTRNGLSIEVTDTPGLCDTHLSQELIYKEVGKSVAVASPGPHVLIFTLRCDRRFTEEEFKAYNIIKEMFSEEMNKYMILVFNGLDTFEDEETIAAQRQALDQEIGMFGSNLQTMIRAAGGRYFGMNNKASQAEKEQQIQDLVNMMKDLMSLNGNKYYTTPVTTEIKKTVDKLVDDRAKRLNVSKSQAADNIKKDIVDEKVEPGFFETVGGYVSAGASAIVDACVVM